MHVIEVSYEKFIYAQCCSTKVHLLYTQLAHAKYQMFVKHWGSFRKVGGHLFDHFNVERKRMFDVQARHSTWVMNVLKHLTNLRT